MANKVADWMAKNGIFLLGGGLATACVVGGATALGAFAAGKITGDMAGLLAIAGGFAGIALGSNIGYGVYQLAESEAAERAKIEQKERARVRTQEKTETRDQGLSKALSKTTNRTTVQQKSTVSRGVETPKKTKTGVKKPLKKPTTQVFPKHGGMDPNG